MKPRSSSLTMPFIFSLCAMVAFSGCESMEGYHGFTLQLWEEGAFSHYSGPAVDPRAQLFHSKKPEDVLVTYDEVHETNPKVRRRAFFLSQNLARLQRGRKPHFVDPRKASGLEPVAVLPAGETTPPSRESGGPALWVMISTNGVELTLYSRDDSPITFKLPIYETRGGKVARVALTPVAVLGDVTLVALALGFIALCLYAQSGGAYYH